MPRRGCRRQPATRVTITWRALQRAALVAVTVGGLLGCCGGVLHVRGQEVVLGTDSDGCISSRAPGPPKNLKVGSPFRRLL